MGANPTMAECRASCHEQARCGVSAPAEYAEAWGTDTADKVAIFGPLSLSLAFVNLFQFLMMFLGQRRQQGPSGPHLTPGSCDSGVLLCEENLVALSLQPLDLSTLESRGRSPPTSRIGAATADLSSRRRP